METTTAKIGSLVTGSYRGNAIRGIVSAVGACGFTLTLTAPTTITVGMTTRIEGSLYFFWADAAGLRSVHQTATVVSPDEDLCDILAYLAPAELDRLIEQAA